jgi:predicted RNA-binding protein with PUA-like domain
MARSHWLVKSEPSTYAWARLVKDGRTVWDGVRNPLARQNLAAMRAGDLVLYYHSNVGKEVVGIARVARTAYPDPKDASGKWLAVDLEAVQSLVAPVSLATIKADPKLAGLALIKQSRLSVLPVSKEHFERILALAKTRAPRA